MKKSFTYLIKVFTLATVLLISASSFAQFTIRGGDGTNHATFTAAVNVIKADVNISEAIVDVATTGPHYVNGYSSNFGAGRPLTITVQGASATTTLFKGNTYTMAFGKNSTGGDGTAGKKWLGLDKGSAPSDKDLVFIFKDITFYNWGYNYQGNALVSSYQAVNNIKVSFYNCNFYQMWGTSGHVLSLPANAGSEGYFENCSFYENVIFSYTGKNMNGLISMSAGKLTVKNSTFYSNIIDPRVYTFGATTPDPEVDIKGAQIIGLGSTGDLDVTLENNAFINNAPQGGEDFIHPAIAVKKNKSAFTTTITMKNNIFMGNRRTGRANDADIYFEDTTTVVFNTASTGNIATKVIKRVWNTQTNVYDYVSVTNLPGFKISESYTYAHPDIMFTMDDVLPLPKITVDNKGINHVQYSGNGGTVSAKNERTIPGVKVFPNPTTGLIGLSLPTYLINSAYEVYNVSGVKVKAGTIAGNLGSIDLSKAPKGIYMLKVIKGSDISVQRIILK